MFDLNLIIQFWLKIVLLYPNFINSTKRHMQTIHDQQFHPVSKKYRLQSKSSSRLHQNHAASDPILLKLIMNNISKKLFSHNPDFFQTCVMLSYKELSRFGLIRGGRNNETIGGIDLASCTNT